MDHDTSFASSSKNTASFANPTPTLPTPTPIVSISQPNNLITNP